MATVAQLKSRAPRIAVAFAAAIALLLPLPARCASCAASRDQCPKCSAAKADNAPAATDTARTCCQHRSTALATDADYDDASVGQSHHACGCGFGPAPRNTQPTQNARVTPDVAATLSLPATVPASLNANASAAAASIVSLPPLVPHRILHCSWII